VKKNEDSSPDSHSGAHGETPTLKNLRETLREACRALVDHIEERETNSPAFENLKSEAEGLFYRGVLEAVDDYSSPDEREPGYHFGVERRYYYPRNEWRLIDTDFWGLRVHGRVFTQAYLNFGTSQQHTFEKAPHPRMVLRTHRTPGPDLHVVAANVDEALRFAASFEPNGEYVHRAGEVVNWIQTKMTKSEPKFT